jgi:hypothetical protein
MKLGRDAACLAVPRRRGCTVAVHMEPESRITWMAWIGVMECGLYTCNVRDPSMPPHLDLGQELGSRP